MKKIIFSSIFILLTLLSFAQNKPKFILEQTVSGYDVILTLESFSNLSAIRVEGILKQNNFTEDINLDLKIMDVKYKKAFTRIKNDNIHAEFVVIIIDNDGNETRYPSVDLNILKDS